MNEFLEKFLADRSASRPLAEDEYIDKKPSEEQLRYAREL